MRTSERASKYQIIHWSDVMPRDTKRYKAVKIVSTGRDTWYKAHDIGEIFMVDMKTMKSYEGGNKQCVNIVTEKYVVLDIGFDTRHIEYVPIATDHFSDDLFTL